jgi:hypothetical protein
MRLLINQKYETALKSILKINLLVNSKNKPIKVIVGIDGTYSMHPTFNSIKLSIAESFERIY